jgi:L-lactate dehydrogenase complex protein LldG
VSGAREEVLGSVRAALRDGGPPVSDPTGYRRSLGASRDELVALFAERCGEYRAEVRVVARTELREAIAAALADRGARRVVVPPDLPADWRPHGDVELVVDAELSHAELDAADGVLTGSAAAIAETGTIVLDAGPGQGRRALTLLPDYHLCVVEADTIVGLAPELFERIGAERPVTLVSGPSATSDIELKRVEGVHGPRVLVVLVAA